MKHHALDNTLELETEGIKCVCCLNYDDPTLKVEKSASPEKSKSAVGV